MGIIVRAADRGDLDALVRLWQGLGADGHAADPRYRIRSDAAAVARSFIARQWLGPDHGVAVAVEDELVGFMTVRMSPPHPVLETPPTAVITDAYVAPGHRRSGVGRRLFAHVLGWSDAGGVQRLEVGTLTLDRRAVAFWRAVGFGDWRVVLARPCGPGM